MKCATKATKEETKNMVDIIVLHMEAVAAVCWFTVATVKKKDPQTQIWSYLNAFTNQAKRRSK